MRVGGLRYVLAVYPRERPSTHCVGGWVGPRAVWTGAENLASTGIRSLDLPALRTSNLYRLFGIIFNKIEGSHAHVRVQAGRWHFGRGAQTPDGRSLGRLSFVMVVSSVHGSSSVRNLLYVGRLVPNNSEVVLRFLGTIYGHIVVGILQKRQAGCLYPKQAGGLTSVQKSAALHWLLSPASKWPPVLSEKLTLSLKYSTVGDCCTAYTRLCNRV